MYRYSQPTLWQKFTRSLRAICISIRRMLLHLRLRYRSIEPVGRTTIFDADSADANSASSESQIPSPPLSERTRAGFLLSSNRKAPTHLTEERHANDDHTDDELDDDAIEPAELSTVASIRESGAFLETTEDEISPAEKHDPAEKTRLVAATADPSEDVPSGWLNEWFGPTSPRRNAWLFTSVTGVLGMILALLLLFSGHRPSQNPEEISLASGTGKPDPFEITETEPDPFMPPVEEKSPIEEIEEPEPKPEPIVDPQPEPEPEPVIQPKPEPVVAELPDKPKPVAPEPEPEDQFDLRVILLPDPENPDQGEEFEVTGEETVVNLTEGFDPIEAALWRETLPIDESQIDPWKDLEQLVPLGPLEPQSTATEAHPRREIVSEFLSTQPPRAVQSLLMPYEFTVTNQSTSAIDRLRMTQTLPAAVRLRSTSSVHAHSQQDRLLSWEFENLSPQETWRIPLVVIPTEEGTVAFQTTLEETVRVSSQTLVLTPAIELEILADSHAPLNKYHRLLFRMTNTGEVPLKNLQMGVVLSENLWHRFGNKFGFAETDLEVGEVREALLHVKTLEDGEGIIEAKLTTDEGAESTAAVSFAIGNARPIETKPLDNKTPPPAAPARLVPTLEIGETPIKPNPREVPDNATPVTPEEQPLIPAEDSTEPTPGKPAAPAKEKPVLDDFPAFPGELDPLPPKTEEKTPPREAPIPAKREPVKQPDPFEIPVKKEPVEDLFKADR